MLLDLFNHGSTFFALTCIYTNLYQFVGIQRVINFSEYVFTESGTTDYDNDFKVMNQFT